jgi:hypothetical protein
MRIISGVVAGVAAMSIVTGADAKLIHDESIDGDISSVASAPTVFVLSPGSNVIRGTTDESDGDFFHVEVPEPWLLQSVNLVEYWQSALTEDHGVPGQLADHGAFLGLERGTSFDTSGGALYGAALVGVAPGRRVGDDLLFALGMEPDYWEEGFTPPLPAGSYTFWYQQTEGDTAYAMDVVITPLPAALPALVTGLAALGWLARRRRRASAV